MKFRSNPFLAVAIASVVAFSSSAWALELTKADNTTLLDLGGSWGGTAPASSDVAVWSGAYVTTGSLSAAFTAGTPVSWQGIKISSITGTAAGPVSIGGTGTAVTGSKITIGTSGIDMSSANQNLVMNAATIELGGATQTWSIASGRNLRFGTTGTTAGNANLDGTAGTVVTVQGGGLVDANQGGGTGFTDASGFAGFNGKWVVSTGTSLRGLRNGATAWGTNSSADAITLSGGTLAVGGISGTQGSWTWNTPITLTASTNSSIDQQIFSGTGRFLKLMGAMTGDATTNLIFKETGATDSFSSDDLGYIIAVDNPNLAGTMTIWGAGATENNITSRVSSVRVGGVNGATDVTTAAGSAGTLGTATVVNNGVLTLSRSDTWTFGNSIAGTGSLRIGGGVTGAGTQVVTLSGNNSHSGGTTVGASGSTLKIGHASALGTGALTIGTTAILDNPTGSALSIANALTMSGGSPTFTGTSDMSIGGAVTISGLTAGSTRTITVSANTLTLSGAIAESGGAGQGLTKAGPGTLTLSNTNSSFTGLVALSGGTTNVAKLANTGSNSSLGAGNVLYTVRLNGGTLNYNGAGGDTTDRTIQMAASGAINNNSTTGTIAFTGSSVTHSGTSARTLTLGGTYTGGANTFGSSITDSGTGVNLTSLLKNGASLWTLGVANTYTGTTTISAGTLEIGASGSLASTTVNVTGGTLKPADTASGGFANSTGITVSSGALLDVSSAPSFALGSTLTLNAGRTSGFATDVNGTLTSGGTINPSSNGTKGTLSVGGGLSLTGGTLNFDLTSGALTAGGGVNDLVSATGALNLSGSTTVNVTWTGAIQPGTYTLINGASLGSGDTTNLIKGAGLINAGRTAFALDTTTTPGSVLLTVTGAPASLKWVGDGAANEWDIDTTSNWNNGSGADKYLDLDYLTFDDTSTNGTVALGVTASPGSVTFNNSATAYTISGSGKISGTTTLTKSGSSALTLSTANDYSGGTTLTSGALMCGTNTALGTGTLSLNGGFLSSDSASPRTLANTVAVGGDVTLGDAVNNGALTLSGGVNLGGSTRQLTVASDVTLSGSLSNGGLTKSGTGTLALGVANTYTGVTAVSGGTLRLSGSGTLASASAVTVDSTGIMEYAVGAQTISNTITNNGAVTRVSGTGNLYFSSTANTGTGAWGCNSGFVGFNTLASLGSTTAINLNGGGIYFATNNQVVPGTITVTLGASGGTLNGSTNNTSTWNSKFTGAGGLTKVSGETAILAGNNDYTGTTTLNTGVLRITGTTNTTAGAISFNGGTLQIANGGSFTTTGVSGNTSFAGSLNVNAGGTLSVGSMTWSFAPVTFTVDGTLNTAGALTASWNAAKTLSGTGTINAGSFANNNFSDTTIALNRLNLGGNITMASPGSITLSGVTLGAYANWTGSAPMVLAAATTSTVNTLDSVDGTTARTVTLNGALSGLGSLAKTGIGTLALTVGSSYGGTTTVTGGTLSLGASNILPATDISIGAATLAVGAGFSDTVGTLDPTAAATINLGTGSTLAFAASNGVDWAGGTLDITGTFAAASSIRFGTTSGGLTSTQLAQISVNGSGAGTYALDSNGYLIVAGFSAWATANAPDQTIIQDHDNDGVSNGIEYFMGLTGNGFTANPVPSASNLVSWPKGASYTGIYGTDYVIQISSDLGIIDPWTDVPVGNVTIDGDSVDYDLDTAPVSPSKFARLKVTGP